MREMVAELGAQFRDPLWRVTSGKLYKILTKDDADQPDAVLPFIPNAAQARLINDMWHRNVWLKARQVGGTTLAAILWLDHAMFNAHQRCGIVAHDRESAETIFRDKVKFAYDNLPDQIRAAFPLGKNSASELLFAHNGSSFRVATSMRSGTIHRLHVSELGKLAADNPKRAREVVRGSLQAVPQNGIAIVESTAEGMSGHFYEIASTAQRLAEEEKELSPKEYRFHFVAWHDEVKYRTDPRLVRITAKEQEYFDKIETETGVDLDQEQRAWYVATRDSDFAGDAAAMWSEYPSTPEECWQQSTEGVYYADQLARARMEGRICRLPVVSGVPVNSFWDIGSNDGCGLYLHQRVGAENRFLAYIEGWFKGFDYFVAHMSQWADNHGPIVWGDHYLPHDAEALRQDKTSVISPLKMLEELKPGWSYKIVPRVRDLNHGIQQTRLAFSTYYFDEVGCKEALAHLGSYRRKYNFAVNGWMDEPFKDKHTEAADALRQHAQGYETPAVLAGSVPTRNAHTRRTR